jgi:hypothetical protein
MSLSLPLCVTCDEPIAFAGGQWKHVFQLTFDGTAGPVKYTRHCWDDGEETGVWDPTVIPPARMVGGVTPADVEAGHFPGSPAFPAGPCPECVAGFRFPHSSRCQEETARLRRLNPPQS